MQVMWCQGGEHKEEIGYKGAEVSTVMSLNF